MPTVTTLVTPQNKRVFHELILHLIKSQSPTRTLEIIQNFNTQNPQADWSQLEDPWRLRACLPLLHEIEQANSLPLIPEQTRLKWIASSMLLKFRNEWLKGKILLLSQAFADEHVDALFLKGAARLFTLYADNPGGRILKDMDILVRPEQVSAAERALRKIGAREDYEKYSLSENNPRLTKQFFTQEHYHHIYYLDEMQIELHWHISKHLGPEALDHLFSHATRLNAGTTFIPILAPEEDIVLTALNCLKDLNPLGDGPSPVRSWQNMDMLTYFTLLPLQEIAAITRRRKIPYHWERVRALAKELGQEYLITSFILIAHKICGEDLPIDARNILSAYPLTKRFLKESALLLTNDIPGHFLLQRSVYGLRHHRDWLLRKSKKTGRILARALGKAH